MPTTDVSEPRVVPANEGTILEAFDSRLQIKLSGEHTDRSLTVSLATIWPGSGPPPHIHRDEDELFLIIDGQFRFLMDGHWSEAYGAGTTVYTPRGVRHTFQNAGDTPGHFWGITTPSGFEHFFAQCADVFAQAGPLDMARILAISTEHGLEYMPPLTGIPQ